MYRLVFSILVIAMVAFIYLVTSDTASDKTTGQKPAPTKRSDDLSGFKMN